MKKSKLGIALVTACLAVACLLPTASAEATSNDLKTCALSWNNWGSDNTAQACISTKNVNTGRPTYTGTQKYRMYAWIGTSDYHYRYGAHYTTFYYGGAGSVRSDIENLINGYPHTYLETSGFDFCNRTKLGGD